MIYVTGDLHGEIDLPKLDTFYNMDGAKLTRDDYMIILGDFGMIFSADEQYGYIGEKMRLYEYFEVKYPWTTLFIDGNHENFVHLKMFPKQKWNGGEISILTDHCFWLRRGNIYTIDGNTFLTIGGAYSIDKSWRRPLISWWPDEDITRRDINRAKRNLAMHNNRVDYVLTHCAPYPIYYQIALQEKFIMDNKPASKNEYMLQEINEYIEFHHWFFGHYHINQDFEDGKYTCLYNEIRKL
jgi:hypothetical protein